MNLVLNISPFLMVDKMESIFVNVLAQNNDCNLKYYSKDAAGVDLHSMSLYCLLPNTPTLISTGLSLKIPQGFTGFIKGRSSMALKGIFVFDGVVDADYIGEIKVILVNVTNESIIINPFERIAQIVFLKYYYAIFEPIVTNLTERTGGFGSTGI